MKKPLKMTFVNGPLHRQLMEMHWIPEVSMFMDPAAKAVYAYIRDEMHYYYDPGLSSQLSAVYDAVKGKFPTNHLKPLGEAKESLDTGD
jgi:hypothetical protein